MTTADTTSGSSTGTQTVAITVAEATTVTETVTALSGTENTAISLNGFVSVSDTPNVGDLLTTTLAVTSGGITVGSAGGTTVGGNGGGTVTLTGTAAAINAALATTSYSGNTNFFGTDHLAVTTADTTSGSSTGTQTVAITVAGGDDGYETRHGAERDREHGDLAERICVGVGYAERWRPAGRRRWR